jgi:predicted Rossmann fold flavoprotein
MTFPDIIVVGGGPAGMMAAGQAAQAGSRTLLLEKMPLPGRKLGITGKGRCNLTNSAEIEEFIAHFGPSGRFLRQAFARFFNHELMDFFETLGLPLVTERGGRVFPGSGQAGDVLKVLHSWLRRCGVEMETSARVDELAVVDGRITAVVCRGREIPCRAVVLATGGASYPATGSTGDGYKFAAVLGHRIIDIRPALVPLETAGSAAGRMAELNLRNIRARLLVDGKKAAEDFGELVFTCFGVTGPVILTLSGLAVDALRNGRKVALSLDLKPAMDEEKLDRRLLRDLDARGKEPLSSLLRGLLPRQMVPVCLDLIELPPERIAATLTGKERRRLRQWIKDFRFEVTGFRPFAEAIVTAGGVDTREVDPRTMESRRIKRLYLAGELLNLQADTGGYNLQAAFSTGWLAGRCAARAVAEEGRVV